MTFTTARFVGRVAAFACLAGCLLVGSHRLAAQQAPAPAARAAAAADRWEPAIARFEEQDRVTPPPANAIVFVGASSIVRWNLPESFPELGPKAINRGFGGSLIGDSVKYADRIGAQAAPEVGRHAS